MAHDLLLIGSGWNVLQYVLAAVQFGLWLALFIALAVFHRHHAAIATTTAVAFCFAAVNLLILAQPFVPAVALEMLREARMIIQNALGVVVLCMVLWTVSVVNSPDDPRDFLCRIWRKAREGESE